MNKARRKIINENKEKLSKIKDDLSDVLLDEEMALDNTMEYFPDAERTQAMEEAVDILTDVVDSLDEVIDKLDEIE